eukprot:GILK01006184.1.p1 GENE.GILK01006184.1~~GILK01006184.1.p1  ORF type:complete len:671 (+),score=120.08 GILK01006184.1:42-2054(+)
MLNVVGAKFTGTKKMVKRTRASLAAEKLPEGSAATSSTRHARAAARASSAKKRKVSTTKGGRRTLWVDGDGEWVGSSVWEHEDEKESYYEAVIVNGKKIQVGDTVFIATDSKRMKGVGEQKQWVGQVCALWEDTYGAKWYECRWLYWPEEWKDRKHEADSKELYESDHCDENGVETLQGVCKVVAEDEYRRREKKSEDLSNVFFSRFLFRAKTKILDPIPGSQTMHERMVRLSKRQQLMREERQQGQLISCEPQVAAGAGGREGGAKTKAGTVASGRENYSKACSQLQLSAVPASLPCREKERQQLLEFAQGAIERGGSGSALYVSGMPGTGKTATVLEVVRYLNDLHHQGKLPAFEFVEINGMRLPDPHQAYTQLYKALTGKHATPAHAAVLLEKRFKTPDARRKVCVLLVDELDYLVTKKQKVVYNLFDWPSRRHARLVVIGIANTMDLPERLLPRIHSRLGMGRLVFTPYSRDQLKTIIETRLQDLEIFDAQAIELCSRKIASVSGDIRRALQICRRAAEISEREAQQIVSNEKSAAGKSAKVSMMHIDLAVKDLSASSHIQLLSQLRLYERLFIVAIVIELKRLGAELINVESVFDRVEALCHTHQHTTPPRHHLMDVNSRMAAIRLVLLEPSADIKDRYPMLRLNVQTADISHALREDADLSRYL